MGVIVRNNIIKSIVSLGARTGGSGKGLSRGILFECLGSAQRLSIIENNIIEDIWGDEGDSIAAISSLPEGRYGESQLLIRNNVIDTWTRRAIKIQGSNNYITGNLLRSKISDPSLLQQAAAAISLIQGGDQHVLDNTFDSCKHISYISIYSTENENYNNFYIERNKILNVDADTTESIMGIQPNGTNVVIKDNEITCGTGRAISVGLVNNAQISNNRIFCADNATESVIILARSATNVIIDCNYLFAGNRKSFIDNQGARTICRGNLNRTNSQFYIEGSEATNAMVFDNLIDGTSSLSASSASLAGTMIGQNRNQGAQMNIAPADLFVGSLGPAVALAGVYVNAGQKAWLNSPAAGAHLGWVALGAGAAETVSWKTFGEISV